MGAWLLCVVLLKYLSSMKANTVGSAGVDKEPHKVVFQWQGCFVTMFCKQTGGDSIIYFCCLGSKERINCYWFLRHCSEGSECLQKNWVAGQPVIVQTAFENENSFSCYCHKDFFSFLEAVARWCGCGACAINKCFLSPQKDRIQHFSQAILRLINRVLCVHLHTCDNLDLEVRFNSVSMLTIFPRTVSGCENVWQHKGRKFGSCLILF